jgi:hypothetical protein
VSSVISLFMAGVEIMSSWEKAQKKCSGYDNSIIVNKVKDAVLKVKSGEAKFERDSVLFDEIYLFEPLSKRIKFFGKGKYSCMYVILAARSEVHISSLKNN